MATLGHSGSHAEHPVHCEAMIFSDMTFDSSRSLVEIGLEAAMRTLAHAAM
jgi:hypothetical protein